jgi:colicin import membrane protein
MSNSVSYALAALLAVLLHASVVGLLMVNWSGDASPMPTTVQPYYIEAAVVGENPYEARDNKRKQQQNTAREKRRRVEKQRADKARRLKQAELKAENERKREDAEKLSALARLQALEQKKAAEDAEAQAAEDDADRQMRQQAEIEQELALAIREEQNMRRAVTDDEKAMAYVAQIQRDIIQNWSRPPSARNGMQAILRVYLVPTGEVVNVVVEESSGNDAFDRSATLAVTKTERFIVPSTSRQFESHFREFTVLFRPEDLRL